MIHLLSMSIFQLNSLLERAGLRLDVGIFILTMGVMHLEWHDWQQSCLGHLQSSLIGRVFHA